MKTLFVFFTTALLSLSSWAQGPQVSKVWRMNIEKGRTSSLQLAEINPRDEEPLKPVRQARVKVVFSKITYWGGTEPGSGHAKVENLCVRNSQVNVYDIREKSGYVVTGPNDELTCETTFGGNPTKLYFNGLSFISSYAVFPDEGNGPVRTALGGFYGTNVNQPDVFPANLVSISRGLSAPSMIVSGAGQPFTCQNQDCQITNPEIFMATAEILDQ